HPSSHPVRRGLKRPRLLDQRDHTAASSSTCPGGEVSLAAVAMTSSFSRNLEAPPSTNYSAKVGPRPVFASTMFDPPCTASASPSPTGSGFR
ncbi:unnamed protein product, partial [Ectocarpus sp. 12 AP-2014]